MIQFGVKRFEGHQFLALCSFVLIGLIAGEGMIIRAKLCKERVLSLVMILLVMQIFSMATASTRLNELYWKFNCTSFKHKIGGDNRSFGYHAYSFQKSIDMNLSRVDNAIQLFGHQI